MAFDITKESEFIQAVHFGNLEKIRQLVEAANDPNTLANTPTSNSWFPMMIAAQHGHLNIVKYLVENHNVNPHEKNKVKAQEC